MTLAETISFKTNQYASWLISQNADFLEEEKLTDEVMMEWDISPAPSTSMNVEMEINIEG